MQRLNTFYVASRCLRAKECWEVHCTTPTVTTHTWRLLVSPSYLVASIAARLIPSRAQRARALLTPPVKLKNRFCCSISVTCCCAKQTVLRKLYYVL